MKKMEYKFIKLKDIYKKEVWKFKNHIDDFADDKNVDIADFLYLNSEQFYSYSREIINYLYWTILRRDLWPIDADSAADIRLKKIIKINNQALKNVFKND